MSENLRNSILHPDDISEIQKLLEEIDSIGTVIKTKVEDIMSSSILSDSSEWKNWTNELKKYTVKLWDDLIASSTYRIDHEKKEANIWYIETINNSLISWMRETSENIWIIPGLGREFLKELISNISSQWIKIIYIDWIMTTHTSSWFVPVDWFYEKVLSEFLGDWLISRYERQISSLKWWKWEDLKIKVIL